MRVVVEGHERTSSVGITVGRRLLTVGEIVTPATPGSMGRGDAVYGLPLGECHSHAVSLPPVPRAELDRTAELQTAFHLPFERDEAHAICRRRLEADATLLHVLGAPIAHRGDASAVLPLPLALAALADRQGLLDPGSTTLLVWQDGSALMSVTMVGHEVVFAREFVAGADPAAALRMSAQAVYLRAERTMVRPDRALVFGDAGDHADTIADALGIPVDQWALDGVMAPPDAERLAVELGEPDAVLAAGLAVASRWAGAADWNLVGLPRTWRSRIDTLVRAAAVVLPIALLLLLVTLIQVNKARIRGYEAEIAAVDEAAREVLRIKAQSDELRRLLIGPALQLASPRAWQQLLVSLEQARPDGLWLSQISGETGQQLLVAGSARYFGLVTEYMTALQQADTIGSVRLASTSTSADGVDFQMTMTMIANGLPEEIR